MAKISVVVNVVDSELSVLSRALRSVKWADEIVVIDMTSDGKEIEKIGREFGTKIYKHKLVDYVEPVRNFSVAKAIGDWVLIIDPDEEIPVSLAKKLKKIADNPKADYYRLPRKNIIFGKWMKHSRWWPDYNIRFFKKGKVEWTEVIHGVPITVGDGADLLAKKRNALVHYHYVSVEQFLERMGRYTSRQAELLLKNNYKFEWQDLIKRPMGEFLSRFFAGQGYRDGVHGLATATLQALSEFVVYLKIWEKSNFVEKKLGVRDVVGEMKRAEKELNYWQADALVKDGGGIVARVKRKFKL